MCKDVKECPNYLESWWTPAGEGAPKLICDCAPKRLLLQQHHLQIRLEQLQASADASRAEYLNVASQLRCMVDMTQSILLEHAKNLKIENKNEKLPEISSSCS